MKNKWGGPINAKGENWEGEVRSRSPTEVLGKIVAEIGRGKLGVK